MTRKFKFFSYFFIFLFILFVLGWITVERKDTGSFLQLIKSKIPNNIKNVLKSTVFSIPTLNRRIQRQQITIDELNSLIKELNKRVEYLHAEPVLVGSVPNNIKSKAHSYNIRIYPLPFNNYAEWLIKPPAYLEEINNDVIIASGHGVFFSFEKKDIGSNSINLKRIKSNIKDLIKDEKFYLPGPTSIRDLLILDNKILFSFTKKLSDDCYNTSIMISEFNSNYLNFNEFFSYEDCVNGKLHYMSGGRMVFFKNGKILLTIGGWGLKLKAQDENSIIGKIISIDLKTKDYEIIAMGSRNAQGLYYDEDKNIIIHTEHGPKGGDEININFHPDNKIVENYGWPLSSYGEHGDGKFRKEAPLHKSHKDYGFIEPIKYFTPSIGISEIVKIPITFNQKFSNDFFVSAIGWKRNMNAGARSIHHIRLNENFDQIIFEDVIPIGERIRDMIFIKEKNAVLMVLESIPAIGVLTLID